MNELEERRVIRLLNELADAVEPLPAQEVHALLGPPVVERRSRRRPIAPTRALVAAAAAVILGTTVASDLTRSQPSTRGPAPGHAQLASFPEGSALQLLLSADGVPRTS